MTIKYIYIVFIFTLIACRNENQVSSKPENIKKEIASNKDINQIKTTATETATTDAEEHPILVVENTTNYKIGEINDPDGFSNLRQAKNAKSKILSKILAGEYFFYLPIKNESWYLVKDLKGNIGYLHKSRILGYTGNNFYNISFTDYDKKTEREYRKDTLITYLDLEKACENLWEMELNYESIPLLHKTTNSITFKEKDLQVKFIKEAFNAEQKKPDYKLWGTDGNIPKYQYKQIEIIENGINYSIPKNYLKDLFEPTLEENYIEIITSINNQIILKLLNSDGAGGYVAIFILENRAVKKRIIYIPF